MIKRRIDNIRVGKEPGTLTGTYGEYQFRAKVLDKPSRLCINQGRVLRLCIWTSAAGQLAVYDRGWDYMPIDVTKPIYQAILKFCDSWKGEEENE